MQNFDEDPGLTDLLPAERQQQLTGLLQALTGHRFALNETRSAGAQPVEFNLNALGWLTCADRPELQMPAARLLEFVLYFVGKYRLAANLHHDVTEASFAELQRRNEALQASEARYKGLSDQLQIRVEDQVRVIEKAQRELYESARLRSVGQLAAGVAHEINNPIGFMASNLRVATDYLKELEGKLPRDEATAALLQDFRELLSESLDGAHRIAAIVKDLKTFSNIDNSDFVACDINALLRSACHLIQTECPPGLTLALHLAELPGLMGHPAKLSQAFYNVLDNAVKASGTTGSIVVTSRVGEGGAVEVLVEDQGCGMPAEVLGRVFDPFYTTRDVGSGAGLGLTVTRDIVKAHRGEVEVGSEAGKGTVVTLRFMNR